MPKLFPVSRTIDYTVTQSYLVVANNFDEAAEKVESFIEDTDESASASLQFGVIQISDNMDQIENTHDVFPGKPMVADEAVGIDGSMAKLSLESKASDMYVLLQAAAKNSALIDTKIGAAINKFVVSMQAGINDSSVALTKVIESAEVAQPKSPTRRKP